MSGRDQVLGDELLHRFEGSAHQLDVVDVWALGPELAEDLSQCGAAEAVVSGDDGLVGSLEARFSLADLPVPGFTPGGAAAPLTLAPFIEGGKVWRKDGGGSDTLIGAGAGLLWSPRPGVDAAFYVGAALKGAEDGGGLQGEGVHFVVTIALP